METNTDGVHVTDLERTVIDGINNFEMAGGLEELLRCIGMIPYLDCFKVIGYLTGYDKVVLYQKTGYILEHFKDALKLPEDFFAVCQSKVPKSKRYLYPNLQKEPHMQNKSWALYVPKDLLALTRKGAYDGE